jgi:membrane associated rhomboid family serine protease
MRNMLSKLFENLTHDQVDTYGLVLASSGLKYSIKQTNGGWEIWVTESSYQKALELIKEYTRENEQVVLSGKPEIYQHKKTLSGLWASVLLLVCHLASNMASTPATYIKSYGSSASDILNGEVYRTATSLMLHSGYVHLAGNMAGIAIFGTATCNLVGLGVGWLMILLTGIIGNLFNAALFGYGHISIGASTSVFGAVGILVAYQFYTKMRIADRRKKAWIPLAGGLALLGFLGSGPHSDLTAHLFGFMAGIGLGILHALYLNQFIDKKHQAYCLAITIGTIILAWVLPFRITG